MTGLTLKTTSVARSAMISDDEVYRYRLTRHWAEGDRVCFVMLNPSTANALVDDATIRRCMQFAWDWSYSGIEVVNLFALRSTDPTALVTAKDPVGPANNISIKASVRACPIVVAAWGSSIPTTCLSRVAEVRALVHRHTGSTPHVLGLNADGQPKHPLFLARTLKPVEWKA